MFSLSKNNVNIISFSQSGRQSSKETLPKYSTIPPAFLMSEGHTKKSKMRTLLAFRKFVRNKPPRLHDVRLVTI